MDILHEELTNRDFNEILSLEGQSIRARRRSAGIKIVGDEQSERPVDLFGVALSGGGIRSASFSLGALQALNSWGLIKRIDYLSTVSGGGYIGTSMIAAMNAQLDSAEQSDCKFPFSRTPQENVRDCEAVSHLRDFSRFLAPRGLRDITLSVAVILRGLAVNILLLLSCLLPLATIFVLTNPTTRALEHSILFDVAKYAFPDSWIEWWPPLKGIISDPFVFSKLGLVCLALWLTGWALWRSHRESFPRPGGSLEHNSLGARTGRGLIIFVVVALAMEMQPLVISVVTSDLNINDAGWFKWLTLTVGALLSFIASFQAKLVVWIQHALNMPSVGARLRSLVAKVALYGAALTLPLLIYGVFLAIVVWGIRDDTPPYKPGSLAPPSWLFSIVTSLLAVIFFIVDQSLSRAPMGRPWQAVRAIAKRQFNVYVVLLLAAWVLALPYLAVATRYQSIDSARDWIVLCNYLTLSAAVMMVASAFTENANGLHKLYRDRLRVAYRLWDSAGEPLPLHALPVTAPYLLVNATLNVRVPRKDARQETGNGPPSPAPDTPRAPDPAKRGRNAEFFIFSKHAVGSESTRYADPESLWRIQPDLDLAAAAAISGAAVSSSMGRIGIGMLGPTLALLNLRLGFWLPNPSRPRSRDRHWEDIFRLYLFAEAFGRLRVDSSRIYVTDGGHIDNIGLYQLLKRHCKFIIVIDGEADPAMNFSAFSDVQRFARIDDGTLVSLDWQPVRHAALHRLKDRTKAKSGSTDAPRCAVGRILYENGEEGTLLYVKAAVHGDEPDYVLDYERRYPTFPHEATSDQFFSEEQMEAYRALGFHSVFTALSEVVQEIPWAARGRKSKPPQASTSKLLAQMMERLDAVNLNSAGPRHAPARKRRHNDVGSPSAPELTTTGLNGGGTTDDKSAPASF